MCAPLWSHKTLKVCQKLSSTRKKLALKGTAGVNFCGCFMWAFETEIWSAVPTYLTMCFSSAVNLALVEVAVVHTSMYWYCWHEQLLLGKLWVKNRYRLCLDGHFSPFSYQHVQTQAALLSGNLFFFGPWRENSSQKLLGEISSWHLCCEKGPYLPSLKPNLMVLWHLCETEKYKH